MDSDQSRILFVYNHKEDEQPLTLSEHHRNLWINYHSFIRQANREQQGPRIRNVHLEIIGRLEEKQNRS